MEIKKKRGRRDYLKDFQQTVSGEYIYVGAYYGYVDAGRTRKETLIRFWIFGAAAFLCAAGPGFISGGGMMNCAYVLIPFGAELICACSLVWALVRLSTNPEPLREYVYAATVDALPERSMFTLCFALATAVGELVFLVLHPAERSFGGWMIAVLPAAAAGLSLALRNEVRAARWEQRMTVD